MLSLGVFTAPAVADPTPVPPSDGTNGAFDGPSVIVVGAGDSNVATMLGPTLCEPSSTWLTATGTTKSGRVTTWDKHVKNDSTLERFTWTTETAVKVGASFSVSGTISASAGLAKIASASLGLTSNFGLTGEFASTRTVSRFVEFKSPGKWIIWAGVYTGAGTANQYKCSSSGTSYTRTGYGPGVTFGRARVTGLTNCANSVSDLVEVNAKARC